MNKFLLSSAIAAFAVMAAPAPAQLLGGGGLAGGLGGSLGGMIGGVGGVGGAGL